jgi:hypothetical protein
MQKKKWNRKIMKNLTDEQVNALRDLDIAMTSLRRAVGGKVGESAEKAYGQAYQRCYSLGLKQYPLKVCKTTR